MVQGVINNDWKITHLSLIRCYDIPDDITHNMYYNEDCGGNPCVMYGESANTKE